LDRIAVLKNRNYPYEPDIIGRFLPTQPCNQQSYNAVAFLSETSAPDKVQYPHRCFELAISLSNIGFFTEVDFARRFGYTHTNYFFLA
jgi:hypothetical protein